VRSEVKSMMEIVNLEINELKDKEKSQGYLSGKDKELYDSCMEAFKELYKAGR